MKKVEEKLVIASFNLNYFVVQVLLHCKTRKDQKIFISMIKNIVITKIKKMVISSLRVWQSPNPI